MEIEQRIKAIQTLIDGLLNEEETERIRSYCTIKVLCDEVRDCMMVKKKGASYVKEKLNDVLTHCGAVANLEDRMGHSEMQHMSWARIATNAC